MVCVQSDAEEFRQYTRMGELAIGIRYSGWLRLQRKPGIPPNARTTHGRRGHEPPVARQHGSIKGAIGFGFVD